MGPKRQIDYKGKLVSAQQVEVQSSTENWNIYTLEDGSVLKLKTVLLDVLRLDEYDDKGNPVYNFTAHQIVGIVPADELKKKTE